MKENPELLQTKCGKENYDKLLTLDNPALLDFIAKYVSLCNPSSVFVRTDAPKDIQYIRDMTISGKEEASLKIKGHTAHFDGYFDQARDKENTRFLITKDSDLGRGLNCIERDAGLNEILSFLKNIMQKKQMYILFLCLGPLDSDFSIYAIQITDSAYVAHSEDILYRPAYEAFKRKGANIEFLKYVHSAGELENNVSKNVNKRRVYIDFLDNIVYSLNTRCRNCLCGKIDRYRYQL